MIKISKLIINILQDDEDALVAMRSGILNVAAYARKVKPLVDGLAYRDVPEKTIAVSLYRIIKDTTPLQSIDRVKLLTISIWPSLALVTYPKDIPAVKRIVQSLESSEHFFTLTTGMREMTLISDTQSIATVRSKIENKEKLYIEDLSAVIVGFDPKYLDTPELLYLLLRRIALHGINIVEVMSTSTELAIIVRKEDVNRTAELLGKFL